MYRISFGVGIIALCLTLAWSGLAVAVDVGKYEVIISTADENETTKRIVENLQRKFRADKITITDSSKRLPKKTNAIYLAIGPAAFRGLLLQDLDGVIVSVFTSSQAYRAVLDSVQEPRRSAVTAIYAEPSPLDQLRLIAALYERRIKVGVPISSKNAYLIPILREAASQVNLELTIEPVASDENLNHLLNRLENETILLAVPDNTIYNAENIRNILITTYRRNQPVIGFSLSFVKAGAVATSYSSIEDITAQLNDLIGDFSATGRVPVPQFPKYFNVAINENVARSLNMVIDDKARDLSRKPRVVQQ